MSGREELLALSEWRKIDDAPHDVRILGYMPNRIANEHPYIAVIWWDAQFKNDGWDDKNDCPLFKPAWTAGRVGSFDMEEYAAEEPLFWMRLPAAPAPDAKEGES